MISNEWQYSVRTMISDAMISICNQDQQCYNQHSQCSAIPMTSNEHDHQCYDQQCRRSALIISAMLMFCRPPAVPLRYSPLVHSPADAASRNKRSRTSPAQISECTWPPLATALISLKVEALPLKFRRTQSSKLILTSNQDLSWEAKYILSQNCKSNVFAAFYGATLRSNGSVKAFEKQGFHAHPPPASFQGLLS